MFDLNGGTSLQRPSPTWFFVDGWKGDFSDAKAGLMFARALTAGESFWRGS